MIDRLKEFDVMRAFAIIIILFHHLAGHTFNFYNLNWCGFKYDISWLNQVNRYLGLGIFFFISGWLLSRTNMPLKEWQDIKKFILRRYVRIIPLYSIALIIFFIIFGGTIENRNIISFIIHLFGLQIIFASKYCDPVLTLWFVGIIVSYYFVFAILYKYANSKASFILLALCIPVIFIFLKYSFDLTDKRFIVYYSIFIAGIFSYKYKILEKISWVHLTVAMILFSLAIYLYSKFIYPNIFLSDSKPALFSFVGLGAFVDVNLIMLTFTIIIYKISKYLCMLKIFNVFKFVASASYCMFLFHRPVWWSMAQIYKPDSKIFLLLYIALFGTLVVIVLSYYFQKIYDIYIEKKIMTVMQL